MLSDEWNGAVRAGRRTAEVLDLPEALEPLVEYYRSLSGEHPDWDEYRAAMQRQGKSLIRGHDRALGPDRHRRIPTGPGAVVAAGLIPKDLLDDAAAGRKDEVGSQR